MKGGIGWNLRISGVERYISDVPVSRNYFKTVSKELSLWNKIKYLILNFFRTRCCKPSFFQTQIIWSNRIHSLKYLRSATFGSKDIVIRKSEFVVKTQFLCLKELAWTLERFIASQSLKVWQSFLKSSMNKEKSLKF